MSNDIHVAKVNKIHKNVKGGVNNVLIAGKMRCAESRIEKSEMCALNDICLEGDDVDYYFDRRSPRGGGGNCGMLQSSTEMESPDQTQRDTNESDNNISSCSTLDIINKIDNLSMQQLEGKVRELTQRLQYAEEQSLQLKDQLKKCNKEKELNLKRLEIISSAHECRITEMHCVIAELTKKLHNKEENIIMEEHEPEGSDISYQEGSIYNSEVNLTNPEVECQTDQLCEADYFHTDPEYNLCNDVTGDIKVVNNSNVNKGQVEALQEEILGLKAQIALLQAEMAARPVVDKITLQSQAIATMQGDNSNTAAQNFIPAASNEKSYLENCNDTNMSLDQKYVTSPHRTPAIAKMAERVRLKSAKKSSLEILPLQENKHGGLELSSLEYSEQSRFPAHNSYLVDTSSTPIQVNDDLHNLQRRLDHFKIQNKVLSLTLDETKEHSEHLYLLCGKYESNAIALQAALNCSDRAIEAYDVMLALLESKLALMNEHSSTSAEENRKSVESVARHLLDRFESEKNICENSLGPWQERISLCDKPFPQPWTIEMDNRLRCHVSKLKGRRATIQNTIVQLESPFSDYYEKSRFLNEKIECKANSDKEGRVSNQLDLEAAVLMQELLALREENTQLKIRAEIAERENKCSTERMTSVNEALKQLQLQLHCSSEDSGNRQLLFEGKHNGNSRVSLHSEAKTEQQLIEALTRESILKEHLHTLVTSLAENQKITDDKYEYLHNNVKDLRTANQNLTEIIEQNKRKYQLRIRKLEQKLLNLSTNAVQFSLNETNYEHANHTKQYTTIIPTSITEFVEGEVITATETTL